MNTGQIVHPLEIFDSVVVIAGGRSYAEIDISFALYSEYNYSWREFKSGRRIGVTIMFIEGFGISEFRRKYIIFWNISFFNC